MAANQTQKQNPGPSGAPTDVLSGGMKQRSAPDSTSLLKDIDAQLSKPQKESFDQKRRRILEKCGCL